MAGCCRESPEFVLCGMNVFGLRDVRFVPAVRIGVGYCRTGGQESENIGLFH